MIVADYVITCPTRIRTGASTSTALAIFFSRLVIEQVGKQRDNEPLLSMLNDRNSFRRLEIRGGDAEGCASQKQIFRVM